MTLHVINNTKPNAEDMYQELNDFIDSWMDKGASLADLVLMLDITHHALLNDLLEQSN